MGSALAKENLTNPQGCQRLCQRQRTCLVLHKRYPNFLGPHIYNRLPQILRSGLTSYQLKKHLIDYLKALADPEHLLEIST